MPLACVPRDARAHAARAGSADVLTARAARAQAHVATLIRLLDLPVHLLTAAGEPAIKTPSGYVVSHDAAVTALLYGWANPHTLTKIHTDVGMRPSRCSEVRSALVDIIYDQWYVRLLATDLKHWAADFPEWASAVFEATGRLGFDNVAGFIDGTLRPTVRPSHNQDIMFNGHHWMHGYVYQALVAPNGLIIDLTPPAPGRRHDGFLLRKSRLLSRFQAACLAVGYTVGEFIMYADAGYHASPNLRAAYIRPAGGLLTAAQTSLNFVMSSVRVSVEWGFGRVVALWGHFKLTEKQIVGKTPVGKLYAVAVILTNAHCCFYGNQCSEKFRLLPPDIEDYFNAPMQPAGVDQAWDPTVI